MGKGYELKVGHLIYLLENSYRGWEGGLMSKHMCCTNVGSEFEPPEST